MKTRRVKSGGGTMTAINTTDHSRAWLGIAVALAAGASYAVANTSANLAYQGGSNAMTVAATRFLVPAVALFVWLRLGGVSLQLPKRDTFIALLLGLVTALYTWALLRSFNALPFALAVLTFYLFPLIAAALIAALGWERFVWRTGAAIVLALIGLALALDVRGGNLNAAGIVQALLAAVGLARAFTPIMMSWEPAVVDPPIKTLPSADTYTFLLPLSKAELEAVPNEIVPVPSLATE